MSEENKIGTYQFVAEPFHVDFNGRLTMGVLGNHLLNCAGFHASDRGFGIATLNEDNYTWVLSRLAIELDEMPYQYEKFSVQTWVENVYRLFTDRNFAVIDKDGKKIGYARSVWAMINLPVIVLLGRTALSALKDYTSQRREGKDPVFRAASIGLKEKTDFWN